jgi:hypothetical protein
MNTIEIVYKFNAPRLIHETIDKETVVIDTETGVYFSITGSGYLVIQLLDQGASAAQLAAQLAAAFGLDAAVLRSQMEEFVTTLLAEELIVPTADAPGASVELVLADSEAYAPPLLEKFTDMHDLLLMDPIHEVSDAGWPHRKL